MILDDKIAKNPYLSTDGKGEGIGGFLALTHLGDPSAGRLKIEMDTEKDRVADGEIKGGFNAACCHLTNSLQGITWRALIGMSAKFAG